MHCLHYGGCTEGDHGSWSEYSCNMSLSLSWSFMVFGGLWFFFVDLVHIQGEHVLRGSITLCPWCQRGRVIWCCCHQVQRGRLLALWCMCCTWWQPSHRRISHLCIIFRRDIRRTAQRNQMRNLQKRCQMWLMEDSSKESDDSSKCDKLALPSSPKGEIVGIMR